MSRHLTCCTTCSREVGVAQNWNRWQAGQSVEWRAARHRATERKANNSGKREQICPGSHLLVDPTAVFPREVSA